MLLVKPPTRGDLIDIFEGILSGQHSRDEAMSWREAVVGKFGSDALTIADGYWYLESISIIDVPISLGDGENFFIRGRDIEEYVLDLKRTPSVDAFNGIARLRSHQTDPDSIRWPLLMFEQTEPQRLDEVGLFPVRGIFDVHRDLVEHTHLQFEGDLYLIVRQYDDQAHQLMVLGTNRDEVQLREFLSRLGFA